MTGTCATNGQNQESKSGQRTIKSRVTNLLVDKMAANAMAAVQHLRLSGNNSAINKSVPDAGNESPVSSNSSLTSAESAIFDTISDAKPGHLRKPNIGGDLRFGSFDADDTGLSSVTSSGPSEGKRPFKSIESSTSSHPSFEDDDDGRLPKRVALSPSSVPSTTNEIPDLPSLLMPKRQPRSGSSLTKSTGPTTSTSRVANAKVVKPKPKKAPRIVRLKTDVRPRSSIPSHLSWEEYGRQCVLAAQSSRLNPYALHPGEYRLLRHHLTQAQVTTYLNIRNGILRLWVRNPLVSVTKEEAAGLAKETRFFDLAHIAFQWLVRNGYINFGCVEVPHITTPIDGRKKAVRRKTVAVIGAGMAGLGCARQLEALFSQLGDHWTDTGELPPKVVVLEGRSRIGGRVYSHPLRSQVLGSLPNGLRNTAEMGAQIVTGFDHGNPLNAIIRGQLGLRYHLMWDEVTMYDSDGKAVDHERDMLVNKLHNDLLERTSDFRVTSSPVETLEGLSDYLDLCQEPPEIEIGRGPNSPNNAPAIDKSRQQAVPPGLAKLQGRTQVVAGNSSTRTAAQAIKSAGWDLLPGITKHHSLNLEGVARTGSNPTLGATMDEAVNQYQRLVQLTPQDMRLLNWHYADLEYANASTVSNLSLGGHDQDTGNEFEGRHSEVVGGYIQVPRGLMMLPSKLDVRFDATVEKITYADDDANGSAVIECSNGHVLEVDKVVLTSPLGVLKAGSIAFDPPLPTWKKGAIERMGFGLLNKVVLLFEKSFWDEKYDMFGLLNEAERKDSMDPSDYARRRGRFYLIWNCVKNSGRPMLIALMAGKAAHDVEVTDTNSLLKEVMEKLTKTFAPMHVPAPVEVIVTRWKRDPFSRGTYSFVGPDTKPGDYDDMAAPIGNLHFAGEATCGTHPATVHGAYLSGLRAAAEVVDSMIGEVGIPEPLVLPKCQPITAKRTESLPGVVPVVTPLGPTVRRGRPPGASTARPQLEAHAIPAITPTAHPTQFSRSSNNSRATHDEDYEVSILSVILCEIGERPSKPGRPGVNPFLLFANDVWNTCKSDLLGEAGVIADRNDIRAEVGRRWRLASAAVKQPYLEKCEVAQRAANDARKEYEKQVAEWDEKARQLRLAYAKANPRSGNNEPWSSSTGPELFPRRGKVVVNYTEMSDGE